MIKSDDHAQTDADAKTHKDKHTAGDHASTKTSPLPPRSFLGRLSFARRLSIFVVLCVGIIGVFGYEVYDFEARMESYVYQITIFSDIQKLDMALMQRRGVLEEGKILLNAAPKVAFSPEVIRRQEEALVGLDSVFASVKALPGTQAVWATIEQAVSAIPVYQAGIQSGAGTASDIADSTNALNKLLGILNQIHTSLSQAGPAIDDVFGQYQDAVQSKNERIPLLAGLGLVLISMAGLILFYSIKEPVEVLSQRASFIAQGTPLTPSSDEGNDFIVPYTANQDAIGIIARAFRTMQCRELEQLRIKARVAEDAEWANAQNATTADLPSFSLPTEQATDSAIEETPDMYHKTDAIIAQFMTRHNTLAETLRKILNERNILEQQFAQLCDAIDIPNTLDSAQLGILRVHARTCENRLMELHDALEKIKMQVSTAINDGSTATPKSEDPLS